MRGLTKQAIGKFNGARIVTQFAIWGEPVFYIAEEGATPVKLQACISAIRNNKQLRDGGFALLHDFTARIRVSEFRTCPKEEGELQVGTVVYRIKEVIKRPISGEWKLGLCSST